MINNFYLVPFLFLIAFIADAQQMITKKTYHENGKVHIEGTYFVTDINNRPNNSSFVNTNHLIGQDKIKNYVGAYKEYHDNGEFKEKGVYDSNSRKKGAWYTFYRNGEKESLETFEDGYRNGEFKTWYDNGNINMRKSYKKGIRNGIWKKYLENGTLKETHEYNNSGDLINELKLYYDSGILQAKVNFNNETQNVGYAKFFDEKERVDSEGNLFVKSSRNLGEEFEWPSYQTGKWLSYNNKDGGYLFRSITFKKGSPVGENIEYFKNGNIKVKTTTKGYYREKLMIHGKFLAYHENGNLHIVGEYAMSNKTGNWKWYYDNGQLKLEGYYKGGGPQDEFIAYHGNGKIKAKFNHNDKGARHGVYIEYFENGNILSSGVYANGVKEDIWEEFYSSGELRFERKYKKGNLSRTKEYDKKGKMISKNKY